MEGLQHDWLAREADGLSQAANFAPDSLVGYFPHSKILGHDSHCVGCRSLVCDFLPVSVGLKVHGRVEVGLV